MPTTLLQYKVTPRLRRSSESDGVSFVLPVPLPILCNTPELLPALMELQRLKIKHHNSITNLGVAQSITGLNLSVARG